MALALRPQGFWTGSLHERFCVQDMMLVDLVTAA